MYIIINVDLVVSNVKFSVCKLPLYLTEQWKRNLIRVSFNCIRFFVFVIENEYVLYT